MSDKDKADLNLVREFMNLREAGKNDEAIKYFADNFYHKNPKGPVIENDKAKMVEMWNDMDK